MNLGKSNDQEHEVFTNHISTPDPEPVVTVIDPPAADAPPSGGGSIVQTITIIAMFAIIAVVVSSMIGSSISNKAQQISEAIQASTPPAAVETASQDNSPIGLILVIFGALFLLGFTAFIFTMAKRTIQRNKAAAAKDEFVAPELITSLNDVDEDKNKSWLGKR